MGHEESRSLIFTKDDPLFIDKARRMPGSSFIIGADTALRMQDEKWYDGGRGAVINMLTELESLGCHFYVFGREVDGKWVNPEQSYPIIFGKMFIPLDGRWDISSSSLRSQNA
jgi:hypothetical protein